MYQSRKKPARVSDQAESAIKLIRINAVINITGLSKSYIYQLCNQDLFPKSVKLVSGGSAVGWVEAEVLDWVESRIRDRDAPAMAKALCETPQAKHEPRPIAKTIGTPTLLDEFREFFFPDVPPEKAPRKQAPKGSKTK